MRKLFSGLFKCGRRWVFDVGAHSNALNLFIHIAIVVVVAAGADMLRFSAHDADAHYGCAVGFALIHAHHALFTDTHTQSLSLSEREGEQYVHLTA